MWRSLIVLLLTMISLAGCGITVAPQQTANATLDPSGKTITASARGLAVSVRLQDLEIAPYRLQNNITSFYVVLANGGTTPVTIPLDTFVIVDDQARQYHPLPPSAVIDLTKRDSEYLIPYPYVGYYYLEDRETAASSAEMGSDLPYSAQSRPQNILLEALPVQPILPRTNVTGMIYFPIDLYTKNTFEMRLYLPGTSANAPPDIVFPFVVTR